MHPTLARQLRRLCGVDSEEELTQRIAALQNLELAPDLQSFVAGMQDFYSRVNSTYEQNDRDLDLRSRSLEQSSFELNAINDQMRKDIASRNRVLESVHQAASQLLDKEEGNVNALSTFDLEGISALLPVLVEQQEQRRLELFNQRFAMDQHAIVSITDTQGNIQYVNDRFCDISGYARDELIGQNHRVVNSHSHPSPFFEDLWGTIQLGRVWHGEMCNKDKSGTCYWVDASIVPFLDEQGVPYQYIAILTDITASKNMAEHINASKRKYRNLVENVREVIFQIDEKGHLLFLNPAWEEITRFRIDETLGRNFLDYVYTDDMDNAVSVFNKLCNCDITTHKGELRFFHKQGHFCWFELTIQSEVNEETNQLLFTGTLNDITERRRIAQLQSEFVSVVSHELRTPITSIRGALALLDAGKVGELGDGQKKLVNIAHKNSQRLVTLVNDILDMEKLMAGKMNINMKNINLIQLIESGIEANQAYAHTCNATLELFEKPSEANVIADPDRLMQVLSNLLSNAAKFSPSHKPVEIRLEIQGAQAKVSVRDHGTGIPVEFRPRIFSAFAQADSSDTRQQGGTGLGLKISKTLIEKMNGDIGFESEVGVGTCFWITLPLASH